MFWGRSSLKTFDSVKWCDQRRRAGEPCVSPKLVAGIIDLLLKAPELSWVPMGIDFPGTELCLSGRGRVEVKKRKEGNLELVLAELVGWVHRAQGQGLRIQI